MANLTSAFGSLGSAVEDLFSASADMQGAEGYRKAAVYAGQEASISQANSDVRVAQTRRQAYGVIGGQQSDVAGAGFAKGGTAGALLRDSTLQANLAVAATKEQGELETLGFKAEQESDLTKAAQATTAANGSIFGAILSGVGFLAAL